jgi:kexin
MRRIAIITFVLLATPYIPAFSARQPSKRSYSTHDYYVLEHDPFLSFSPQDCADALGVELVEQVGELENHWLVRIPHNAPSKRTSDVDPILRRLTALRRAEETLPQHLQLRSPSDIRRLTRSIRSLEPQIPRLRTKKRAPTPFPEPAPPPVLPTKADEIAQKLGIVDPIFHDQWHFANPDHPSYDLNVSGLWSQGVTGKGVYTAVVDDGLDSTSDDLAANFVSLVMYVPLTYQLNLVFYLELGRVVGLQ